MHLNYPALTFAQVHGLTSCLGNRMTRVYAVIIMPSSHDMAFIHMQLHYSFHVV